MDGKASGQVLEIKDIVDWNLFFRSFMKELKGKKMLIKKVYLNVKTFTGGYSIVHIDIEYLNKPSKTIVLMMHIGELMLKLNMNILSAYISSLSFEEHKKRIKQDFYIEDKDILLQRDDNKVKFVFRVGNKLYSSLKEHYFYNSSYIGNNQMNEVAINYYFEPEPIEINIQ